MSLALRDLFIFWIFTAGLCLAFIWLFSAVLTPFVLGAAIAYLLEPAVEKITKRGLSRWLASLLILSAFLVFFFSVLAFVSPFVWNELQRAVDAVPVLFDRAVSFMTPHVVWLQEKLGKRDAETIQQMMKDHAGNGAKLGGKIAAGLAAGGQAIAGFLALLAVTPVISFFMMAEWQRITSWIDSLLPRQSYKTVKDILRKIDGKIAGFIRGQMSVALALAILYGVALTLARLDYGFLIGCTAGILAIIPYVSSPFGLIVSMGVGWFQYQSASYLAILAGIFALGQVVETYFLTPRLLGRSVDLHPLWIIFAIMAGGTLFGLPGMLLAVPVAAVAGVLIEFALDRYRGSVYFTGCAG